MASTNSGKIKREFIIKSSFFFFFLMYLSRSSSDEVHVRRAGVVFYY